MASRHIISASRRTDIPAYYLDRLRNWVNDGYATVTNPYNGVENRVSLDPSSVHTLVLWSKNFGPFLANAPFLDSYHLYFLFTINDMPHLEPQLPTINGRMQQLQALTQHFGPEHIAWRFDPIVFGTHGPVTPLESFERMAQRVSDTGVTRLIVSFLDFYGKVNKRNTEFNLGLIDPDNSVKRAHLKALSDIAAGYGFKIETCCEDFHDIPGISPASCINGHLLGQLAGEPASTAKDPGQRAGCQCTVSRDIGSYQNMPCPSGCLYCYANPLISQQAGGVS